jgi:hypothetical protein
MSAKKLLQAFAFLLVVQISGAHWMILQSVAWTNMIIENAKKDSMEDALSKTFDGDHPCGLCTAIDQSKKSEKKQEFQLPSFKKEFIDSEMLIVLSAPRHFWENDELWHRLILLVESPLTPPPQFV